MDAGDVLVSLEDGEECTPAIAHRTSAVLAAHGVIVSPAQREADAAADPNADIPEHTAEWVRCLLWPAIVAVAWVPRWIQSERRHPTWDRAFEAGVGTLQAGANNIGRCMCALRLITDPPVGTIPLWLPTLPNSVGCEPNVTAPRKGEWFFPATGDAERTCKLDVSSMFCASFAYPGDPQRDLAGLASLERVVLYLHGGAFCLCSSQTHRALLMRIVQHTGAVVLAPDYRRPPEHPWPVPIDDCLEVYRWLLERISSDRIVFAGDSAGGGLVLAVMAAAKAEGLPLPAGGAMFSPWLDLTDSCSGSWTENQKYDFLPRDWAVRFACAYAGERSLREVSPASVSLEGLPPLLIEVGECECLRDQVVAFIARAKEAGVDVEDHLAPGMVHVFPLFVAIAADGSPPHQAFDHLAAFLDKTVGKRAVEVEEFPSRCVTCKHALTHWKGLSCTWSVVIVVVLMLLMGGAAVEEARGRDKGGSGSY
jgi:monoterpene epsilon-lactone hydrolase